jgi:hypothetical protein
MPSDDEVERVAAVIIAAMCDDYGAPLVSSTAARHAARAVLSAVPSYADGFRPEVLAFAVAMETRLRANDHKGGWGACSAAHLLSRVADEFKELKRAVGDLNGGDILHEAADVANFAMMVADVCGALAPVAAIPSYAQGWDDAKRRAVEAVEHVNMFAIGKRSARQIAVDAIRAIEPEMGTHEARWAALGYFVEWSDLHRAYRIGSLPTPGGEGTFMLYATEPTVQAVDAWIAAREKEVGK